jgi:hypothetical protein
LAGWTPETKHLCVFGMVYPRLMNCHWLTSELASISAENAYARLNIGV